MLWIIINHNFSSLILGASDDEENDSGLGLAVLGALVALLCIIVIFSVVVIVWLGLKYER